MQVSPATLCSSHGWRTRYLVDEADGRGLAAIEELHVDDLELFQADVKSLQLLVLPVQGDDLEEAIVEPQANHPALGVNDADDPGLRGTTDAILSRRPMEMGNRVTTCPRSRTRSWLCNPSSLPNGLRVAEGGQRSPLV